LTGDEPHGGGRVELAHSGKTRAAYIAAIKAADGFDLAPPLAFPRSWLREPNGLRPRGPS
jgi:hypothetical protein